VSIGKDWRALFSETEVAALRTIVVLAPWDLHRRSFLADSFGYLERCRAELPGIDRDGRAALRDLDTRMAEAVVDRARASHVVPMDLSPRPRPPLALPYPPLRRGPRPKMRTGDIRAAICERFGEETPKPTIRNAIEHSPYLASTGGPRPRYYLQKIPHEPGEWFVAAGINPVIIGRRISRFLRRGGRWFATNRVPTPQRIIATLNELEDAMGADLLRALLARPAVQLESFVPAQGLGANAHDTPLG
jgi:hypothetical protein